MAKTYSNMVALDTKAPSFNLLSVNKKYINIEDVKKENGMLVMFISNHCPFVIHYKKIFSTLYATCKKYNIGMVAINSNDATSYPEDSFDLMVEDSNNFAYQFEYLYDETQEIAKKYQATCTPDIFLFDSELKLKYRGQIDDSRPSNDKKVRGRDLLDALSLLGEGKEISKKQIHSMGCNIKWKKGNEPK